MKTKNKPFRRIQQAIVYVLFLLSTHCFAAESSVVLLTIDKVKALYDQQKITLVDVRPIMQFKKGHIKGAGSLPTDATFAKDDRSDLVATITEIQELMGKAGVSLDSHVVIYGDKNFLNISRIFWVLETFGVKKVSIMNSFLTEWKALGYPTETGESMVLSTEVFAHIKEEKLATMLMVFTSMKNNDEALIDARSEQEYSGVHSQTTVHGHIPTAVNIPWMSNLTKDFKRFKPISELRVLYKGLDMKKMNTVYCNKGKESAVNYVALRLLGANVRAYDGSWFEWSMKPGLPVSTGQ
ncbi:MAG: sulfurtransferase [Cycloclasticus sp.]|nr:sulfurtransferase [Cycloclasticus sp.]